MLTQKQKMSPLGLNQKIDYKDIDLLKLCQLFVESLVV